MQFCVSDFECKDDILCLKVRIQQVSFALQRTRATSPPETIHLYIMYGHGHQRVQTTPETKQMKVISDVTFFNMLH